MRAAPLPLRIKLAYGLGSVAYGIKDNGFAYFLLLFYGTVVGLEPALAGTALLIALLFDAVSDPLVGYWSDNTRSRLGRRHPFMYASALPVAMCYYLLWQPPDWGSQGLFFYLLGFAILIRTLITFFETPSSAFMPELTQDYDERTTVQAWRHFFGWAGGASLAVIMFGVLLVPTDEYAVGTLNREGYETYGQLASVLIFVVILISALGTQSRVHITDFPARPPKRIGELFGEMLELLLDRSFLALFISGMASAAAAGLTAALTFLMLTYFWEFSSLQIFYWTAMVVVSAALGLLVAPRVARRLGKKRAVITLGIVAFLLQPAAVVLRLFGWLPENGDPRLFPMLLTLQTIDLGLIIAMQAVSASMVADLVEQAEVRTGRRNEGVFFAAMTFIRKTNQGIGAFIAGLLLQIVAFPNGAAPSEVSADTVWNLGALLVPSQYLLWGVMLVAIGFYRIDRSQHEAHLKVLADRDAPSQSDEP
ncbi:MAG: MFS transporter [Luminiphilus sp.]|nr:MFS transporter [Luminiphilus sp.]